MTALCGGGTSGALPGAAAVTLLASGALGVALQRYGAGWLQWALPFLTLPELTLSTFCGTDPPAIPTFTAAESKALVDVTLGSDFTSGLSKFSDLIQHLAWYQLCYCTSGALTALPAAPAPPAGTPVYTPPPLQLAAPCSTWTKPSSAGLTGVQTFSVWIGNFIPPGATSYRIVSHSSINIAPGDRYHYQMRETVGGGSVNTDLTTVFPASGSASFIGAIRNPNATYLSGDIIGEGDAGNSSALDTLEFFCNGALPGSNVAPCCPPDAATQLQLDSILRMVTLLQRQLVPFAYIASTAHAGLTGQGTIAVQGLLGLRIDLTTMPGSLTQDLSTPPFVYNVGWVSLEDANGFIDETRAHAQHQNWFSRIASEATLIGYSFAPGVIATITELQREP